MRIAARERRFLIIGGLAVAAYLAAVYVLEPFIAWQFQMREDIRRQTADLERHRLVASERERYQRRVEELRSHLQQGEELRFQGEKPPLVAAEIQGVLHRIGQEAGVTIMRENVLAPKKVEMFTQVTVELSIRGEMRAIRDFLYQVQAVPKLLTVPKLSLRGATSRAQPFLTADLQIAGYMLGGDDKTPVAPPPAKGGTVPPAPPRR